MTHAEVEDTAEDFERVYTDYQLTAPWRLFRRLRLLGEALVLLLHYVAVLDKARCGQINASRRCEGR
jgi:hypothetical protein